MDIKILEKFQEFKSSVRDKMIGIYRVKVNGDSFIITRNGDEIKIIQHGLDGTTLSNPTDKFKRALLDILQ